MRAPESVLFSNISATTAAFLLIGGKYMVSVVGTSFGTVKLQRVGPDGSTMIDIKQPFDKPDGTGGTEEDLVISVFAANGSKVFDLGPGNYEFVIASTTGVYAEIVRIPND